MYHRSEICLLQYHMYKYIKEIEFILLNINTEEIYKYMAKLEYNKYIYSIISANT